MSPAAKQTEAEKADKASEEDMPKGNDEQAIAEFQTQYGDYQNAEQLREAHQATLDPELAKASLRHVDDEATKELDLGNIDPANGGTVLDAVVRGGNIVYVAEAEDGRTYKGIQPYEG